MAMKQLTRATAPLLLATALAIPGCRPSPLHNRDLMGTGDERPRTTVAFRDAQKEISQPKRTLEVVPVLLTPEEAKHYKMGYKKPEKVIPLDFR